MAIRPTDVIDSDELARRRRDELDIDRDHARAIGESAVQATRIGYYRRADGTRLDWAADVAFAVASATDISPGSPLPTSLLPANHEVTGVVVAHETTLDAANQLVSRGHRPLALNMANGVTPGGGFLHGARAQEENLCRSSALYATLKGKDFYAAHRANNDRESSAAMILSPDVPVFRTDDGTPLDQPWKCSFITAAAPYEPSVGQPRSGDLLALRINRLLEAATAYGYENLVLGAWGCGAFGNDPHRTAADFRSALEGPFAGRFQTVIFAITDWSPERRFLGPFRDIFSVA